MEGKLCKSFKQCNIDGSSENINDVRVMDFCNKKMSVYTPL